MSSQPFTVEFDVPNGDVLAALIHQNALDRPWMMVRALAGDRFQLLSDPVRHWLLTARARPARIAQVLNEAEHLLAATRDAGPDRPDPESAFTGLLAGFASYELGARFEAFTLAPHTFAAWPGLALALFDTSVEFHGRHVRITSFGWRVVERSDTDKPVLLADQDLARRLVLLWQARLLDLRRRAKRAPAIRGRLRRHPPRGGFARQVAHLREEIAAGDLFQANLSWPHGIRLANKLHPAAIFSALARQSPSRYLTYVRLPARILIANSPELFFRQYCEGDDYWLESAPIKGTIAALPEPARDRVQQQTLRDSEKDKAENRMIVDLVRHDLSRLSEPGSVELRELFALHSTAFVHHLVSSVRGRVSQVQGLYEILAALFPIGSVTGAPKPAALHRIAHYERQARGPYCGTLFWREPDGNLEACVLIRSAGFVKSRGVWRGLYRAGAGITIDSHPDTESAEIDAKARQWARLLGGEG